MHGNSINDTQSPNSGLSASDIIVSGGNVSATGKGQYGIGAFAENSVTLSGGFFSAVSENNTGLQCVNGFSMSGGELYCSGTDNLSGCLEVYAEKPLLSNSVWISSPDDGYIGKAPPGCLHVERQIR